MSERQYRDQLVRFAKELAELRKAEAAAHTGASKARSAAASSRAKVKPTMSPTLVRSHEGAAQRTDRQAEALEKKAVGISAKIADVTKKINVAEGALERERHTSARREEQAAARQRRVEIDHARKVAQLSRPVVRHVYEVRKVPAAKQEELRILYLTASPIMTREAALRVDAEVAQVQRAVRGALHRDYVRISHRPAATPEDLVDGLNDLSPHVIHFSGHAGKGAILMDNSDVADPQGRNLSFPQLGRALSTAPHTPTLLILNACDTVEGAAEELLPSVPVVVAMNSSVLDTTAAIFASRFYAAVAAGLPIQKAFDQAVLGVELVGLDDESWMITLLHRADVDPARIWLVRRSRDNPKFDA